MDAIEQLAEWLAAHAPDTRDAIAPPTDPAVIRAAEAVTGIWPAEIIDFYRYCNGTSRTPAGYLFPNFRPLSVSEVADTWQTMHSDPSPHSLDAAVVTAEAGTDAGWFLSSFLPIAEDQSGSWLVVDRRDGAKTGCLATWDSDVGDAGPTRWDGLIVMINAELVALRRGEPVEPSYWIPAITDGKLFWEVDLSQ